MKNITRKTFLKTVQAATFLGVMSTCLPKTFTTGNFTDELVATSDTQYISDESSYEQIGNNPTITFALNK